MQRLVAALGAEPSPEAFLPVQEADTLWQAVDSELERPSTSRWHRVWGDRLAGEVAATLRGLADHLGVATAYLLVDGASAHAQARTSGREAVHVPIAAILRHEAANVSPRSDLRLISADERSGLVLGWDHLGGYADEYSLQTWGAFAVDITAPVDEIGTDRESPTVDGDQ